MDSLVVMIVQSCEYIKTHWTVQFKWENFMVCKLYLNKAAIKKYYRCWLFKENIVNYFIISICTLKENLLKTQLSISNEANDRQKS